MEQRKVSQQQAQNGSNQDGILVRKDVYAIVTERIIEQLEKGTVPWRQPWTDAGIPRNLVSKRPYRGINVILLSMLGYEHNLFLTYNQLQDFGGNIKKGEHGHLVVYWNYLEPSPKEGQAKDDNGALAKELRNQRGAKKKVPYLRYYLVYNIAQSEGIPQGKIPVRQTWQYDPFPACEEVVEKMPQCPRFRYGHVQSAFYDASLDYINMPDPNSFDSGESYYATLFHELVHSTGHHSRLNRKDLLQMQELDRLEAYSREELVAEIGSCYLLSFCGITGQMEQSADYIRGWLAKLRSDRKFIFTAATQAQKATDFILNLPNEVLIEEVSKPKPGNCRVLSWEGRLLHCSLR